MFWDGLICLISFFPLAGSLTYGFNNQTVNTKPLPLDVFRLRWWWHGGLSWVLDLWGLALFFWTQKHGTIQDFIVGTGAFLDFWRNVEEHLERPWRSLKTLRVSTTNHTQLLRIRNGLRSKRTGSGFVIRRWLHRLKPTALMSLGGDLARGGCCYQLMMFLYDVWSMMVFKCWFNDLDWWIDWWIDILKISSKFLSTVSSGSEMSLDFFADSGWWLEWVDSSHWWPIAGRSSKRPILWWCATQPSERRFPTFLWLTDAYCTVYGCLRIICKGWRVNC